MKDTKVVPRWVPRWFFEKKMEALDPRIRNEIETFINSHIGKISRYEYGRIPKHRTYSVVLLDGTSRSWLVRKKH